MARTTVALVRGILPTTTQLTDAQIQSAINAATCVVDQIVECASQLSDECLIEVETWLSAHYAAAMENTLSLTSEKDSCSKSSVSYGFKFGKGVNGTPYGQMANTLSGGCLAELDKQPTSLLAIGCH